MLTVMVRTDPGMGAARSPPRWPTPRYLPLARRRGKLKALVAIARSILVIVWHLLAARAARYSDLGRDFYATRVNNNRKTATTSASSRPSATPSPSPRPPDHLTTLTTFTRLR